MAKHHPGRGGPTWLRIESKCTYDTVRRAIRNEPILTEPARKRLSAATRGEVTEEELKAGGVRAKPQRKVVRKLARKGSARARRKKSANRKTSAVRSAA